MGTVADMWSALVAKFMHKSMLMETELHAEFKGMHYKKGADLRAQFDIIHMKYKCRNYTMSNSIISTLA
jgi:hypothetical protein